MFIGEQRMWTTGGGFVMKIKTICCLYKINSIRQLNRIAAILVEIVIYCKYECNNYELYKKANKVSDVSCFSLFV